MYILYNDLFIYDKICKYVYSKLTILKCKYIFFILENNNYNYRITFIGDYQESAIYIPIGFINYWISILILTLKKSTVIFN